MQKTIKELKINSRNLIETIEKMRVNDELVRNYEEFKGNPISCILYMDNILFFV